MTIKKWVLFVLLVGNCLLGRGQWSTDLSQNTRVTTAGTTCFGAIADDAGGVLVVWGENAAGGATMYAQRYRADGTISLPKKALFSDPRSADCTKNAFTAVQLLRADNSDDIYVVFSLKQDFVFPGSTGTYTEFLQYQIVSLSTCNTKIPNQSNQNKGHNLGYNYGDNSTSALRFRARFIQDDGRVLVAWQQRNNPSDPNRGGGGTLANGTDLRMAVLNAADLNGPVAYRRDDATGEQTFPIFYARADLIFIAYRNNGNRLYVKRFSLTGNSIAPAWSGGVGGARDIGDIPNTETPIVAVQTKLTNSGEMVVYSVGEAVNLSAPIRAHRFDVNGTVNGQANIIAPDQFGAVNTAAAQLSAVTTLFYTKNNRQNIQRYEGTATRSAVTPISQVPAGGDATFSGTKVSGYPTEQYLVIGKNGGNGSKELYGQFIKFPNDTNEGERLWGDNGKLVTSANSDKSFWLTFGLSNRNTFFIWRDQRSSPGCGSDVYCQVLDEQGNVIPSGKVEFRTPEIASSRAAQLIAFDAISSTARAVCTSDTFQINFRTSGTFPAGTRIKVYFEQIPGGALTEIQNFDAATVGDFQTARRSFGSISTTAFGFQLRIRAENGATILSSAVSTDKYYLTLSPGSPSIRSSNGQLNSCGNIALLGTGMGGHTFDWQRNNLDLMRSSTNRIDSLVATQAMGSGNYSLVAWSGSACVRCSTKICPTRSNVLVLQFTNSSVPAPTVTATVAYCVAQSAVPLTAMGTSLKWYTAAIGGVGSSTAPTPTTVAAGTTSYFVSQTVGGCESTRAEIKVTVSTTPTVTANANTRKPLPICAGLTIALTATSGFSSYQWSGPNGFNSTGATPTGFMATVAASGTYRVTATGTCGTATDSVRITVNPIPVPNASSSKSTYIVGETIQFNSGSGTGYTYLWTGPGFSSAETRQNPTISNAQTTMTGDYTVTITANDCEAKGTVNITVTTQPVTGIDNVSATASSACPGAEINVNFTIIPSNGVGNFNVYLADANGQKIGASIANDAQSPIKAILPASAAPGNMYRILVETSPTISKASSNAFTVLQRATAQMLSPTKDTSIVARKTGDNLSARMRIQGSGPFTLNFSAGTRTVRNAGDTTLTFRFENDGVFSFQSISNACGAGALTGVQSARITLKRVVAVEEDTLANSAVSVFPNPISDRLNVQIKNGKAGQATQLRLYDLKGSLLKTQFFYNDRYQWETGSFPVGNYLLEVVQEDKKQSFRVIKE